MNDINKKKIQFAVRDAADAIQDTLQPVQGHPLRNATAHVWKAIKDKFGDTYSQLPDDRIVEILDYIAEVKKES